MIQKLTVAPLFYNGIWEAQNNLYCRELVCVLYRRHFGGSFISAALIIRFFITFERCVCIRCVGVIIDLHKLKDGLMMTAGTLWI
jgi:hypothetical protein